MESKQTATPDLLTDGAVGVPGRSWFVAVVDSNREFVVRDQLQQLGCEAFVASRPEVHFWANRQRKLIERLLITHYVFVHATEQERMQAVRLPLVRSFLVNRAGTRTCRGTRPLAVIPAEQIRLLRAMLSQSDAEVMFSPEDLTVGQSVVVAGMGGEEMEAQVIRLPNDRHRYVGVAIDGLGCAYMHVPASRILRLLRPKSRP